MREVQHERLDLELAGDVRVAQHALSGHRLVLDVEIQTRGPGPRDDVEDGACRSDPAVGEVELFVLPLATAEQVLPAVPKNAIDDPAPIAPAGRVDSTFDGVPWSVGLIALWLAIALGLGLVRGWRRHRFEREISDREPVTDRTAIALLDRVCCAAGVENPVSLSSSSTLASPVALGGREICIPERALEELDRPLMEALFAHELAHIERRDPEWLIAVLAFESAFFFQPLNFIAARAIRTAAEEECDRAAVELVGEGHALARCLVEVASWIRRACGLVARARSPR
jgi:hypothetical protein